MEYLASEPVLEEFYARTLFIPGHLGLAERGIDFQTGLELAADALTVFSSEVPKLDDTAFALQGYSYNRVVLDATMNRLTQAMVGELTLDEAIARMQADIDEGIAAAAQ